MPTYLTSSVVQWLLEPRPPDRPEQGIPEVLTEQTVDVEGQRVVDELHQIGESSEKLKWETILIKFELTAGEVFEPTWKE